QVVSQGKTGTITVVIYQCPLDIVVEDATPDSCEQDNESSLWLSLWNSSIGFDSSLEEAEKNPDGSYTWYDLPLSMYNLAPENLPSGYGAIYIPDLGSYACAGDCNEFPPGSDRV